MALTAATIDRESNGSLTLHRVTFSSVTSAGDTWASGLPNVWGYWANVTSSQGVLTTSGGVNVVNSSGTFTIVPNLHNAPVTLFVQSKT